MEKTATDFLADAVADRVLERLGHAQPAPFARQDAENVKTETSGKPDPSDADRGKTRSAWVDAKRAAEKWTSDLDIQNSGGPTYNTIQRYRSGKKSTHDPAVRLKFAAAFSCELIEVPE
jgi:hypothetical protein